MGILSDLYDKTRMTRSSKESKESKENEKENKERKEDKEITTKLSFSILIMISNKIIIYIL